MRLISSDEVAVSLIEHFLKMKKLRINFKGIFVRDGIGTASSRVDNKTELRSLLAYIESELAARAAAGNRIGVRPKTLMDAGLALIKSREAEAYLEKIKAQIKFNEAKAAYGKGQLVTWLHGILYREPSPPETAVMQHFLHQIKRKMYHCEPKHHMMPIITGFQGSGKSSGIKRLLEPIGELSNFCANFSDLDDKNKVYMFQNNFAIFFDELARIDKADINELKQIMTRAETEHRGMYSEELFPVQQLATFIGAANERVADTIIDYTGMRRFYDLQAPLRPPTNRSETAKFQEMMMSVDVLAIWQSIDESADLLADFSANLMEIQDTQRKMKATTAVEEFIASRYFDRVTDEAMGKWISGQVIFQKFMTFVEENNYNNKHNSRALYRKLREVGFKDRIVKDSVQFLVKENRGGVYYNERSDKIKLLTSNEGEE